MYNQIIIETSSLKFLWVIIDNNLTWHEHIVYIKNKISKSIGIIYKARKHINNQTLKIYTMILYFHILYIVMRYGEILLKLT